MSTEPEDWVRELEEAGWTRAAGHLWRSPDNRFFLGPYGAWRVMKGDDPKGHAEFSPPRKIASLAELREGSAE